MRINLMGIFLSLLVTALVSSVASAAQHPCAISFEEWVIHRVPAGYAVNPATLTLSPQGVCVYHKELPQNNVVVSVKNATVNIYDDKTGRNIKDRASITITLSEDGRRASVYSAYLFVDVIYSDKTGGATMLREGNDLILFNTKAIRTLDAAPPHYILAKGGRIVLHNWF